MILDIESELSRDDLHAEFENETVIKACTSACDLELGKERNLAIDGDAEGLLGEVDLDDDLSKSTVSSLA